MKALAFLPPSPTARFAAYADVDDGSVIVRPVDYFVLVEDKDPRVDCPVKGVNANDGLCEEDDNFLGYAESEAQAKERFADDAKKIAGAKE